MAEMCVHWSCQGARLWDQPTWWEAAERGIPQYAIKALSLKGLSCCMEMQAVKKNQLRPSKRSLNETMRELESLMQRSCTPSVPVRVNTASASVSGTV